MNDQQQEQKQRDDTLPVQPGHVMRREYYERMAREASQPAKKQK